MNKKEWQAIEQARTLFNLGEQATADEIKRAYRQMCKKYHPDTAEKGEKKSNAAMMCRLTESHDLLLRYIKGYRFPLKPDKDTQDTDDDPEDWWMNRFGDDPLWGKGQQ